jgi:hypothetical protein
MAPGAPVGMKAGGGRRGAKKPGTPRVSTAAAPASLNSSRAQWPGSQGSAASQAVMPSQKARRLATRRSGGLPAMIAALMAPIEIPANQAGCCPPAASAS